MSGAAAKLHGTPAVTPAPALGGTRSRCRSDGHYVKSYGSASYDSHRAKQTPASQPPPEPLKRVASNTAGRAGDRPHPGTPPTASSPQPSSANYVDSDVDVSPLSSPSQSYVPEHRRRRATSGGPQRTPPSDTQSQTAAAAAVSTTTAATSDVRRTPPPPSRSCANGKENAPLASHAGSTVSSSPPPPPPPGNDTAAAAAPVSPPPPQQQQQQQPVREDTARTAAATTAFTRLASGYQQHQQQRRHATAPAAAPRHPPHAPATTVAVAARRGGGGGGGAGAVRGAQARSASSKARPVTATARKRPPPPPPPPLSSVVEPEPDAATVSPSPCRSPERDVAQEQQLAETESVLDYVASVVRALGERRRCAAPPQAAEGFRASVVPCRRSVGHSASPDAAERGGGGGLGSPGTPYSAHRSDDDGSVALLPDIHRAAGKLLSAYTKLEYAQLGEDVDVALLEREVVEHSAQLLRLIDGVERRLSLHESSPVRHALARRRNIFRSAHELVHFIARMVHEVVLLRDLALRHDLSQAQEVWSAFRTGVEAASPPPPLPPPADDVRRGGPSLFSAAAMMRASPFLAWLEQRWFCVMRQWRQLQLEARHAAGGGDADGAVRRCRQAALRIDGLQEILRPGESISCLLHNEVERPIAEMGKTLALRRAVVAALREVLDSDAAADGTLTAADLSKALKAVQAVSSGGDAASVAAGGAEDAELVRRAEELLGRLHEAELLHRTATTTLQLAAPELVTLLEHITRANELLVLWKRAHDEAAAQAAVVAGRAALDAYRQQQQQQQQQALQRHSGSLSDTSRSSSSPHGDAACVCPTPTRANGGSTTAAVPWIGGGLPLAFDPHGLYAAHTPGGPWSPDLSMAYMELCEVFTAHYTQRHARRELELALTRPAAATDNRRSGHSGSLSLSPQATPRRPTRDDASPADTWRSSDGSAQPTQRLPSGPSAEELRRRLQQAEDAGVDGPLVEEARARLRRLDTLRLKIHFDAHTRVLPVTDAANADFRIVSAQIFRFCQTPQHTPAHTPPPPPSPSAPSSTGVERRLRIRYEDTDGDFISLVDQQDWRMMLSELAPHGCNGAKIELFCDYPTQPGPTSHSTTAAAADADADVVADHRIGADSELASADVPTESAAEEGTAPAEVGGSASAAAATGERRTNVFERLATSVKSSAAAAATGTSGASRKLRVHPHAARTTSPQRALMAAQRGRGAPHGAARTVSPQKTGGAVRRGAAAGRSKDSPPSPAANSATAELTAENLRRNAPSPQSSPRPDAVAPADSTPAEPQRSSEPAAPPAAPQPPTAAVDAAVVVDAHAVDGGACADVARESSIVHLDLDAARRWTSAGGGGDDDDLQLLEIQTRASMSTIRPERSVALSESAMSRTMRPTEMPPRAAAAPRNTFTTTHCSSKVVVVTAAAEEDEEGQPKKRVANSPSRPPRRWSTDVFSLDEVETVCSDRSRMPRHPAEPKGPASLPPRPVSSSGGGGGARTPQRGRRGARGTPTRPRPEAAAVEELCGTDRDDDDAGATSEEVLLEMQRMRDANSRAMTQRKPSWH